MQVSLLADQPKVVETIAEWYFDEWGHKDPATSVETIQAKVLLGINRDAVPVAFYITFEEEVIGAGEIKYRELPEYPDYKYWLDGIFVPAEHRGKGISTRLIEFAKDKAAALNIPILYLSCEEHNVALYERRGFKVVRHNKDRFIMEYVINQGSILDSGCSQKSSIFE